MASRRRRRRRGLGPPSSSDNLDEAFERGEEETQTFDPTVEIEEPLIRPPHGHPPRASNLVGLTDKFETHQGFQKFRVERVGPEEGSGQGDPVENWCITITSCLEVRCNGFACSLKVCQESSNLGTSDETIRIKRRSSAPSVQFLDRGSRAGVRALVH